MKAEIIKILNKSIADGLEDNEKLLIFSIKRQIELVRPSFETEYQLDEFRELQSQYFDEDGKAYTGTIFDLDMTERMLKLINQLEAELTGQAV